MKNLKEEFELYVQTQQYDKADKLVEKLLASDDIVSIQRKEALEFLYRIGYVYPKLTLAICQQRHDIPKPFKDTLKIELGKIPFLRIYNHADTLIAIKIALLRKKPHIAQFLINRFYKQYGLTSINLIKNNKMIIGSNDSHLEKTNNLVKITVVVTTYNSELYIKNCIESLLNQSINNIEIIVVDDASTDQTLSILSSYSDIKIIPLEKNQGTYNARNIGIQHAHGKFITFQDSDDWSHPERLELQLKNLLSNPNITANFSRFFRVNIETGLPDCRQLYPLLRLNLSSLMIRKQKLLDIGGFDSTQRVESDMKLLQKLKDNNKNISFLDKPLAIGAYRKNSLTSGSEFGFNKYGFSIHRNLL